MEHKSNEQFKADHVKQKALVRATVHEAETITLDVVDDAMLHLVDHWQRPNDVRYQHDHVFLIARGFIGHKKETAETCSAKLGYQRGNLHGLATDLCSMMHEDAEFAAAICHAVNLFWRGDKV